MNIPTTLTPEQAEQLTELLHLARNQLQEVAGRLSESGPYGSTCRRIADVLRDLGVDPD